MLKFNCRDVGVDCDFVATGATIEEVRDQAFAHAAVVHADLMKAMSDDDKAKLAQAVDANIKTV